MPDSYPEHLPPQSHYHHIELNELPAGHHVSRFSTDPPGEVFDEDGDLYPSQIGQPRKNALDVSTALLGIFQPADHRFEVIGDRRIVLTYNIWEGETVLAIGSEEFRERKVTVAYHFSIADVNALRYTYPEEAPTLVGAARVIHTPVHSNFWHCSIQPTDEAGLPALAFEGSKSSVKKRRSALLEAFRIELARCAIRGEIEVPHLPESSYS